MPGFGIRCVSGAASRLRPLVRELLASWLGTAPARRVVIKPNWVHHQVDPAFPIEALVTDARLIEATVEACLELLPRAESILVCDCPLQSADWPRLCQQTGLGPVMERLEGGNSGRVSFRDLRKESFQKQAGNFLVPAQANCGDPLGYREIELGSRSHLEPISGRADRFGVNDYSAEVTRCNHRPGSHRYLISQSILEADLFINLPKWKTHAKAGLTGALKNLVGVNGDKAYLPHFRRGAPRWGGDEYADEGRWLYWAQTVLRERVQKRSRLAYQLLKPGWEMLKRLWGIETRFEDPQHPPRRFYAAGGSWPGNQTLWRMVYDLNLIIQCADARGQLHPAPVRRYFCLVDGLISGEGNGPLQPLGRPLDWLIAGEDPFAIDTALGWFMGFRPDRLPILAHRASYAGPEWGRFDLEDLTAEVDGRISRLIDSPINFRFAPPPGWRDHLER